MNIYTGSNPLTTEEFDYEKEKIGMILPDFKNLSSSDKSTGRMIHYFSGDKTMKILVDFFYNRKSFCIESNIPLTNRDINFKDFRKKLEESEESLVKIGYNLIPRELSFFEYYKQGNYDKEIYSSLEELLNPLMKNYKKIFGESIKNYNFGVYTPSVTSGSEIFKPVRQGFSLPCREDGTVDLNFLSRKFKNISFDSSIGITSLQFINNEKNI